MNYQGGAAHKLKPSLTTPNPQRQLRPPIPPAPALVRTQLRFHDLTKAHTDPQRYNIPTSDDVAIILPSDGMPEGDRHDIILHLKGGGLKKIHEGQPAYAPLHYVLLFPRGELGWHWNIPVVGKQRLLQEDQEASQALESTRTGSQINYSAYCLHQCELEATTLLCGGKLLQQFMVDSWGAADQRRLSWIKHNQGQLQADVYHGVRDAFASGDQVDASEVGQKFILPATFQGSSRDMLQNLQNSLAISRKWGTADAFITMTANTKWPEITSALLPGQKVEDWPDLVTCVFEIKKKALLHKITKENALGAPVAHVYIIKFQKHGLPHMHCLVWFEE